MPGPVFLRGERVELRTVEKEDIEFVQRLVNDPAVWSTLGASRPKNRQQEMEWVESIGDDSDDQFLVCVDGDPVGLVGVHPNETWGKAELGYMISPEAWGNGYCTDAVRTVSLYAFEERRMHKVVAEAYDHNVGSQRVLEKVGFTLEGTHREEAYVGGQYRDLLHYGLLEGEFKR